MLARRFDDFRATFFPGQILRRLAVLVLCTGVCAGTNQTSGGLNVSSPGRYVKRRIPLSGLFRLHVRPCGNELVDDLRASILIHLRRATHGAVKWSTILGTEVDIGPMSDQEINDGDPASPSRRV